MRYCAYALIKSYISMFVLGRMVMRPYKWM